ncbi:LrgB family protein [uncultured Ruthenibacterium sp.]|uniref:LrgB family protein n=1 Tax=uncultured Ruthenibacterium sp. TaxID=1905347 RepID=UPI00349EE712
MMSAITSSPLFGIVLCIASFLLGRWIQEKTHSPLANPLLISFALCVAVLCLFDIPYENFAKGGDILNMMLGPVTAVLALGIYNQYSVLKRYFWPVLLGCTAGSLTSIFSVLALCHLFGLDQALTAAMLPKSCTTPIALSIAESHGGLAAIAAACVMIAGLTGSLCAPLFAKWFRIQDPVAQGLATGACSHALGTIKAREMGELQGAMSSIAIGVCGLISVIITIFL